MPIYKGVFSGRSVYEVVNKTVNGILPSGRFVPALIIHYERKLRLVIALDCLEPTVQEQGSPSRIKIGFEAGIDTGIRGVMGFVAPSHDAPAVPEKHGDGGPVIQSGV